MKRGVGKQYKRNLFKRNKNKISRLNGKKPIFGSDCNIEVLQERPAARYLPELQAVLIEHNERFQEKQIEKIIESNSRKSPGI